MALNSPLTTLSARPRPKLDADGAPFWAAAREERLVIQRCADCGTLRYYPRRQCPVCWSDTCEWVQASGRGTIYTWSIVRRAPSPGFQDIVPYAVALIDLDEGVRVLSRLVDSALEEVRIGASVQVRFEVLDNEVTLPLFTLTDAGEVPE
jgi:uncharacterized protein